MKRFVWKGSILSALHSKTRQRSEQQTVTSWDYTVSSSVVERFNHVQETFYYNLQPRLNPGNTQIWLSPWLAPESRPMGIISRLHISPLISQIIHLWTRSLMSVFYSVLFKGRLLSWWNNHLIVFLFLAVCCIGMYISILSARIFW